MVFSRLKSTSVAKWCGGRRSACKAVGGFDSRDSSWCSGRFLRRYDKNTQVFYALYCIMYIGDLVPMTQDTLMLCEFSSIINIK